MAGLDTRIKHPAQPNTALVTREAFESVYKNLGWSVDEPAAEPAAEPAGEIAPAEGGEVPAKSRAR